MLLILTTATKKKVSKIKLLMSEFNIPIIATSEVFKFIDTKSSQDKRPNLSDLRDGGILEYAADVVMFLIREALYKRELD